MQQNANIDLFKHIHDSETPVFFLVENQITFANKAFADLTGHDLSIFNDTSAYSIFPKDDFDKLFKSFDEENDEKKETNLKLLTKSLEIKILNISYFCLNKKKKQYLLFCNDITASKVTQRKMIKAKAYVDSIFTNLDEGVIVIDNEEKILNINNGALRYGINTVNIIISEIISKYNLVDENWKDISNKNIEFKNNTDNSVYLSANIKKTIIDKVHAVFIISFKDITKHIVLEKEIQDQKDILQKQYNKMDKELKFSKSIQEKIVPPALCESSDLLIATRFYIANSMGGDYFEIMNNKDKYLFGIFDVSGHGVASSLIVMMLKAILRTVEIDSVKDSKEIFYYLQKNFNNKIPGKHFVACVFCQYFPKLESINFTCGGNYLPLHVDSKTGNITEPGKRGFPIGFIKNPSFDSTTISFKKGDKLVMFSDGIVEATNDQNEYFGHKRVVALIKKYYKYSAHFLQNILYKELIDYIGGEVNQGDDVTIMVVSKEEEPLFTKEFELNKFIENIKQNINEDLFNKMNHILQEFKTFMTNDDTLVCNNATLNIYKENFTTTIRIKNLESARLTSFILEKENLDYFYSEEKGYLYLEFRE